MEESGCGQSIQHHITIVELLCPSFLHSPEVEDLRGGGSVLIHSERDGDSPPVLSKPRKVILLSS